MTNPTPSLAQVLAEMRAHRQALDAADFTGKHIIICKILVKLPEWAAALAKYEPLVRAAEALAQTMPRELKGTAAWSSAPWCHAMTRLADEALALFAKEESDAD